MATADDANTAPLGESSDQLTTHRSQQALQSSPVAASVRELLARMNASGDDAEEQYQEALQRVRDQASDAVIELARAEAVAQRDDYSTRWAIVYAAAALENRAALPFLRRTALDPIPPERNEDPHASTVASETVIRTTAVDGIAALALRGDDDAVRTLQQCMAMPSFSIRRAAVQGLLASPRADDLREWLQTSVPEDQAFLLNLKRSDVRDVPQIENPQRHLSERARNRNKSVAPDLPDRRQQEPRRDGYGGESPNASKQED